MDERLPRKLVAILYADVVNYSRLTGVNEDTTHRALSEYLDLISETVNTYHGEIMHYAGDAVLAKFEAVIDAVSSATEIQEQLLTRNANLPEEQKVQFRIGVNLGDVIEDRGDIYGDGVNIAARLESVADPGGVCVSASVFEQIRGKLDFHFEDMGEQEFKNIAEKIRSYRVIPIPAQLSPDTFEALVGERLELPDKPSIAVLPFQNMSGDPEQEYFVDGMSEDVITALSRIPDLVVIARNSTFVYKDRAVDVRQVGRELGVGHVLEGSIRKSGDRLRITAQLVSTESGDHVWAERYDRNLDDIFAIQDEITHNIVVELQAQLVSGDSSLRMTSSTKSVEAWELTTRAASLIGSHVHDKAIAAKQLIDRALELDKNYAIAWNELGWIHWEESVWKWSSDPEQSMQMAFDIAQKALSLDVNNPHTYSLLGHIYLVRNDAKQAIAMCEKSIELAPGDSMLLALFANVLVDSGQLKEGIQKIQRAIRLCPYPPAWYLLVLGAGFHLIGDNESAVSALEQAVKREPDSHLARVWLVSTLAELGKLDEAQVVSKEVIAIDPAFSALSWADSYRSKSHDRLKDNLLNAGLPK
jgi:adenylate cyclase